MNKSKVDAVGIGVDQNAWNANKQSYKIDRYARLPNVTSNYLMRYKYAKYTHYNDSI